MHYFGSATLPSPFFVATVAVIGLVVPLLESIAAEPVLETPKGYSSPVAVFDAFRASRDQQDWQTILPCLTPELRDDQVFEAFFACSMQRSNPRIVAVLKKHGVDSEAILAEYHKRYKEKHGVDIAKLLADRKAAAEKAAPSRKPQEGTQSSGEGIAVPGSSSEQLGPPRPPDDEALLRTAICAAVRNKAAFCGDVDSVITNSKRPTPIGKLEQLRVHGDTAVGLAKTMIYHTRSGPEESLQKVGQEIGLNFRFRKLNGSWLIESKEQ